MNVKLNTDLQRFVEDQVKSGQFPSIDALFDEAVGRMKAEVEDDLDDETAAAINRAEEQLDRGEGIDFRKFAAEMRARLAIK